LDLVMALPDLSPEDVAQINVVLDNADLINGKTDSAGIF
jgi:hypothetical protein